MFFLSASQSLRFWEFSCLRRAMDYLVELFRNLHDNPDWSMSKACSEAYGKTLKKWHNWLASSSFSVRTLTYWCLSAQCHSLFFQPFKRLYLMSFSLSIEADQSRICMLFCLSNKQKKGKSFLYAIQMWFDQFLHLGRPSSIWFEAHWFFLDNICFYFWFHDHPLRKRKWNCSDSLRSKCRLELSLHQIGRNLWTY